METSASVYEAIAVLAEVSLVWSLSLLGHVVRPLREAHQDIVDRLSAATGIENTKLPKSVRFGLSISKVALWTPRLALMSSVAVLGGLAFSPASAFAQLALLIVIVATFIAHGLFTFLNRELVYKSSSDTSITPSE